TGNQTGFPVALRSYQCLPRRSSQTCARCQPRTVRDLVAGAGRCGVETHRFTVSLRNGQDGWVLILDGLKNRFGGSPETVEGRVMVGGPERPRSVRGDVVECLVAD